MKSSDRGDTWSTPYKFPDTLRFKYAAARGDTIVVTGWKPKQYYGFRYSTDGGETWKISKYKYNGNSNVIAMTPGTVHFVKQWGVDSIEFVILYRKSTDLGETWSDSIPLSPLNIWSVESVIGADDVNDSAMVYVGWKDSRYGCQTLAFCSIVERHLTLPDSIWSEDRVHTPEPNGVGASIATKMPLAVVAWTAEIPPNYFTLTRVSKDNGKTWCIPYYIGSSSGGPADVAISSYTVHITWADGTSPYRIMYRRGVVLQTDVKGTNDEIPEQFSLNQNYPNPFNPQTTISFDLPHAGYVVLKVYNVYGQEVAKLVDEKKEAGKHRIEWNASRFPSGVYFYKIISGKYIETRKAILVK
jgi:hypothetical protein